ncbi:hypothetical protein [Streptomyces sp. QTS52]
MLDSSSRRRNAENHPRGMVLVVLSLFEIRAFGAGTGAHLMFSCIPAGFFLSWTLYLQGGLGWSALHTGLTAIPFSLGVPIAGNFAVRKLFPAMDATACSPGRC